LLVKGSSKIQSLYGKETGGEGRSDETSHCWLLFNAANTCVCIKSGKVLQSSEHTFFNANILKVYSPFPGVYLCLCSCRISYYSFHWLLHLLVSVEEMKSVVLSVLSPDSDRNTTVYLPHGLHALPSEMILHSFLDHWFATPHFQKDLTSSSQCPYLTDTEHYGSRYSIENLHALTDACILYWWVALKRQSW
jgi:hypothetical protein